MNKVFQCLKLLLESPWCLREMKVTTTTTIAATPD